MTIEPHLPFATEGRVEGVFAGPIRSLRSPREPGGESTDWRSAILKSRHDGPVFVGPLGLAGDAQKEKKHHGGPTKAVLVYGTVHYARWDATLRPHAEEHAAVLRAMSGAFDASSWGLGAFGENLAVSGPSEADTCLGDVWRIGGCVLEITEPRGPCATLTRRWMRPSLLDDVKATAAAGWYNRVREPGPVQAGDRVELLERIDGAWSVARTFHLLEARRVPRSDVIALRDAPGTHEGLRDRLERRLATPGRTSEE